ncbi:M16 family metallopeptidase [Erythrobacter dokdonensis]|uniref:Peptidase, M16 family protein n=1 Tax=Erythrobacter dokdonensis DSW-74 TaxID=1300349 RepID=A0A1A7BJV7_9SPHN|nr:M16 family metallopeptidase [Erythrobacter dokdonensis]OBV11465.1 Peptidase, M16 family protein [Erythrobacter dokdonensis DSW-74]
MTPLYRTIGAGLLLALSPLALATALTAQDAPIAATADQAGDPVWAFEQSDVPVDPAYVFGRLGNGMRYVIRRNATPQGTALVRMRIDSGSLEENDSERGLSHYLEHMAFNGSKGIPEGEMVKLLEREGLAFGADTNASTGFESITYMLNLPRNDAALLETALMLMRETASELTIAEEAVARERGVILAERRDRAGFQQRNFEDNVAFIAPGARYGERLPIGTLEVLENATAAQIRALYERTYTPANTVLVVIGDYPVEQVEDAIRARFADWAAGPVPREPEAGPIDITRKGLTDIHLDPALAEEITLSRLAPWHDEPDTVANRDAALARRIGYGIINRRLASLARSEDAPFRGASFGTGEVFEDARITSLTISSADGEWEKGVLAAVREVNQALSFGFTQAELDEQLANLRTAYENAVKGADTRSHSVFVGAALASDERVPATPEWQLARFEELARTLTPDAVWQAVKAHAAPLEDPLIRFEGRSAPEGGETALRDVFDRAMALEIAPPEENGPLEFAYQDFGTPGQVVSDTVEPRLGLRFIRFANGVRLTLKQTTIREDRIAFALSVDGGDLMNTREDPLKVALTDALALGGLGKHSQDDLSSVLAGRSVGLSLGSGADTFASSGNTTRRDLALQLQVLAALLTDPGYRREGEERFRKGIENYFATLDATPGRALGTALGGILSDNDPRFTLQSKEAFLALEYAQLQAAIGDRLARGAIEIALVGDLDEAEAIAAVAATFGALPDREAEFKRREDARTRSFTATRGPRVLTHKGEADQALLQWTWPTTDDSDLGNTLRLDLLARILRIALTEKLREELGQAYSPSTGSSNSRIYRDYGSFSLAVSVDVSQIDETRAAVGEVLTQLRDAPPSEDIIERARRPLLENYDNALKDLGGWINLAARSQSDPERLDRWFAAPDMIRAITPEELQATAARWLAQGGAVEVAVVPEESGVR